MLVNSSVVALTEAGILVLIRPTPDGYVELGRFQAVTGKCWNCPAVCDGRVYVRSTSQAACYDLSISELRLSCSGLVKGTGLEMTVSTANGRPLDSNRLARIQVLATKDLDAPVGQWTKLTNELVLTNGWVRVAPVDTSAAGQQFFRVAETVSQP